MKLLEGTGKLDLTFESNDSWVTMRIIADQASVDFSTTDRDGGEREPSFEFTWPEILQACQEYLAK